MPYNLKRLLLNSSPLLLYFPRGVSPCATHAIFHGLATTTVYTKNSNLCQWNLIKSKLPTLREAAISLPQKSLIVITVPRRMGNTAHHHQVCDALPEAVILLLMAIYVCPVTNAQWLPKPALRVWLAKENALWSYQFAGTCVTGHMLCKSHSYFDKISFSHSYNSLP